MARVFGGLREIGDGRVLGFFSLKKKEMGGFWWLKRVYIGGH